MKDKLRERWFRIPSKVRKPVTLTVGMLFVLAAGLTGWLPGPGGIPLFLIGVAILSTEYEWARRFKDLTLSIVATVGKWLRAHPKIMALSIICTGLSLGFSIYLISMIFRH